MFRQLTDLNFEMIPSLLAAREISPVELYKVYCFHLQRHILDPARHLRLKLLRV